MKLENHKTSCDVNAERMLISQILLDNNVIYKITDIQLKPKDFYDNGNKRLFSGIYSLLGENKVVDPITLGNKCVEIDVELQLLAITTEGSKEYAQIIKDCSIKRDISNKAFNLSMLAKEEQTNIEELKKRADEMLNVCMLQEHTKDFQEEIDGFYLELFEEPKAKIKTGYKNIDAKLGLGKGQLVTIAGRPGMGKSAVMSCLALSLGNCAFFSLEMSKREIAYRMSSSLSGVEYKTIENGIKDQGQEVQDKIADSFGKIKEKNFAIYDRKIAFLDIKMEIKKLKLTRNIEVVFLDYLQLMRSEDTKAPRSMQIGQITRELKSIAKELDVLIVMGSQLNREVGKRTNKRPQLTDLRESGDIEQDSDIVIFIHREEDEPDAIELQIAKYRNGKQSDIKLFFNGPTMTMKDKLYEFKDDDDSDSIF